MIRGLVLAVAGLVVLAFAVPDGIFNALDAIGWLLFAVGVVDLSTRQPRSHRFRR